MTKFKNIYRIESTRLVNWNYSNPAIYFLTICTKNREQFFGHIEKSEMVLNSYGLIVKNNWEKLKHIHSNILLDEFVIMPDHFHAIIELKEFDQHSPQNKCKDLSEIIRGFKTFSSKEINGERNNIGNSIWQSRFYDRIIRNENELFNTRKYIKENPSRWELQNKNRF